jgi:hypothetical protein
MRTTVVGALVAVITAGQVAKADASGWGEKFGEAARSAYESTRQCASDYKKGYSADDNGSGSKCYNAGRDTRDFVRGASKGWSK